MNKITRQSAARLLTAEIAHHASVTAAFAIETARIAHLEAAVFGGAQWTPPPPGSVN
jgi:hypothetical protein